MSVTEDINGKESAKRKWAGRYLGIGLLTACLYFLMWGAAFILDKELLEFPYQLWFGIVGFGAAILGVTIFESKIK